MRQAKVRDYYGAVLLYNFFAQLNFIKWKNSKLESCRSRRGLQFSYKNHLHPMLYRRVMIFQRFSRYKLEKEKQNRGNCSKSGFTVANRGRTVPCKPCKTGLDLEWTVSQVRGAKCPVSKFMDLFDTALQVQVPTMHFAPPLLLAALHLRCFVTICVYGGHQIREFEVSILKCSNWVCAYWIELNGPTRSTN